MAECDGAPSARNASVEAARPKQPRSGFPNSLLGYIIVFGGVLTAAWLICAAIMFGVGAFFH